jgi:hypothetical protein
VAPGYQFFGLNYQAEVRTAPQHILAAIAGAWTRLGAGTCPPARPGAGTPATDRTGDLKLERVERWTPRRKAKVIDDIANGVITLEQACQQYDLSIDEIAEWQKMHARDGVSGLRVTRLQCYHPERMRWRRQPGRLRHRQ